MELKLDVDSFLEIVFEILNIFHRGQSVSTGNSRRRQNNAIHHPSPSDTCHRFCEIRKYKEINIGLR